MADERNTDAKGTSAAKRHHADMRELVAAGPVVGRDYDPIMFPPSLPRDYLSYPKPDNLGAVVVDGRTEQASPVPGHTNDHMPTPQGAPDTVRSGPDAPWPESIPHRYDAHRALASLRHSLPFLPIHPIPTQIVTVVCAFVGGVAVPYEMIFPERALLCEFRNSSTYYISFNGNAKVPTVADNSIDFGRSNTTLLNPQGRLFYIGGVKSCSVLCPADGTIVQAHCFVGMGTYALPPA